VRESTTELIALQITGALWLQWIAAAANFAEHYFRERLNTLIENVLVSSLPLGGVRGGCEAWRAQAPLPNPLPMGEGERLQTFQNLICD